MVFRFERQACLLPGRKANEEWVNIFVALGRELQRHTGARGFMRSSAVGDHCTVVRNLGKVLLNFVSGHAYRARQFQFGVGPSPRISRVNECEFLAAIHSFLDFVNRYSGRFHICSPPFPFDDF